MNDRPTAIAAEELLVWLETLASRQAVRQMPEVYDAIVTAIAVIDDMVRCGRADQSKVDALFADIIQAIGRGRRRKHQH